MGSRIYCRSKEIFNVNNMLFGALYHEIISVLKKGQYGLSAPLRKMIQHMSVDCYGAVALDMADFDLNKYDVYMFAQLIREVIDTEAIQSAWMLEQCEGLYRAVTEYAQTFEERNSLHVEPRVLIQCRGDAILDIDERYFNQFYAALMQSAKMKHDSISSAVTDLIEIMNQNLFGECGLEAENTEIFIAYYLKAKKDAQLFALLIQEALDRVQNSSSPFAADILEIFMHFHKAIVDYAAQLPTMDGINE